MAFSYDPIDPLTPLSRYALVRAKVERAKKNLVEMERGLHEFHGKVPGTETYIKPRFSDRGEQIEFKVTLDALAAAGDVVNNLRGTLDHLAFHLADAHTPNCSDELLERTCFPIGKDEATYKSLRKRIENLVHPEAIKKIDGLKPYESRSPFALLNEINNISKHRMLLSVGETVYAQADWLAEFSLSDVFQYKIKNPQFWGIYGFPAQYGYVQSPAQESLGNPQVLGGDALLPTLKNLIEVIERVPRAFMPYFV
jgi:hypothetical protein